MMFDYFRQRTQEGFDQVKNIASKTLEGKLGEALQDSADYIKERQKIDYENLKQLTNGEFVSLLVTMTIICKLLLPFVSLSSGLSRSRDRLLKGISDSFSEQDSDIEVTLTKLEDVLLQADIGSATTSIIIDDLRSYAKREGLNKEDILPVLRARLIEALTPPSVSRYACLYNLVIKPYIF